MPQIDPYKVLAVTKSATAEEIKKSYRKLARELHPDKNPGDSRAEEKFKEVQEAYSILSDPQKRKQYDSGGFGFGGQGFGFGGSQGAPNFGDLGDLFGGIFGGGRGGGGRAAKGNDLNTTVSISFEQSLVGTQIAVTVPRETNCETCHGNGSAPGTTPEVCDRCNGSGMESQGQGLFSISGSCRKCAGSGRIIKNPCPTCMGEGTIRKPKRYKVSPGPDSWNLVFINK